MMLKIKKDILRYEGNLDVDKIRLLLNEVKQKINEHESNVSIKKKLFCIAVESLDNIKKHSDIANNNKSNSCLFVLERDEKFYLIKVRNTILNNNILNLQNHLQSINVLNKEGLRKLYAKIITNGEVSDKGGAGLGLIDISIRSGNKLVYSFEKIDDNYSYFTLIIKIDNL